MTTKTVRNQFDRAASQISFKGAKPLTEQSHKQACDINNIMAKFAKTGAIEHVAKYGARYGDVSGADFTQAQFLVAEVKGQFAELPSAIRNRFDNDAAKFLDFVSDPANEPEMAELGLSAGQVPVSAKNPAEAPSGGLAGNQPETPAQNPDSTGPEDGTESGSG